jgi:predicted RNase H-like HicB family nuclease
MRREFNVIIEKDSDGFYVGNVSQLKGCHSQAKSIDEQKKRITETIELCLEAEENDPFISEFVGVQRVIINA